MKKWCMSLLLACVLLVPGALVQARGLSEQHNKHCHVVIGCVAGRFVNGRYVPGSCHPIMVVCPHGHGK